MCFLLFFFVPVFLLSSFVSSCIFVLESQSSSTPDSSSSLSCSPAASHQNISCDGGQMSTGQDQEVD